MKFMVTFTGEAAQCKAASRTGAPPDGVKMLGRDQ
jgi:hypothetical protein